MRLVARTPATANPELISKIAAWLADRPHLHTIATYAAIPGEIDLLPLLAILPERRWVFPKIHDDNLTLHPVENPATDLIPGPWNIPEPAARLRQLVPLSIDAFLCPGLAFDPSGGRLGRGRGFYDRLLAMSRPDALKIGICRPEQLVEDTFSEHHDIPMDLVFSR